MDNALCSARLLRLVLTGVALSKLRTGGHYGDSRMAAAGNVLVHRKDTQGVTRTRRRAERRSSMCGFWKFVE